MVREERVSLQHSWNLLTDGLPRLCGDGYSHQRKLRRQELLLDHGRCGALALGHGGNRAAYGGRVHGVGADQVDLFNPERSEGALYSLTSRGGESSSLESAGIERLHQSRLRAVISHWLIELIGFPRFARDCTKNLSTNSRIGQRVEHVGQEVHKYVGQPDHENAPLHQVIIAAADSGDGETPNPRP